MLGGCFVPIMGMVAQFVKLPVFLLGAFRQYWNKGQELRESDRLSERAMFPVFIIGIFVVPFVRLYLSYAVGLLYCIFSGLFCAYHAAHYRQPKAGFLQMLNYARECDLWFNHQFLGRPHSCYPYQDLQFIYQDEDPITDMFRLEELPAPDAPEA